ncbi:MAG: hypothetical protein SGILL_007520 [Bacillariaceae sp.]
MWEGNAGSGDHAENNPLENEMVQAFSFDEENPCLNQLESKDMATSKRVSAVSDLTDGEPTIRSLPSIEQNLSSETYSTFHVPSGLALAASAVTIPVATDPVRKSSMDCGISSEEAVIRRESRHDELASPLFSASSGDDLDCQHGPVATPASY